MNDRQLGKLLLICVALFWTCLLFLTWSCGGDTKETRGYPLSWGPAEAQAYEEARACLGVDGIPAEVTRQPVHRCSNGAYCCVIDHPEGSAYYDPQTNLIVIGIPEDDYCAAWIDKHALKNEFANNVSCTGLGDCEDRWCRSCGACA